jgi:hypothetical protein
VTKEFREGSDSAVKNENWKPIPGYEGFYKVSDLGSIWSKRRQGSAGGILKTPLDKAGYPAVALTVMGRQRTYKVHVLLMLAFCGPRPDGMEIRHLNGDSADGRLVNLAYGTHSENVLDQVAHGTNGQSRKTHCPAGHPYDAENTRVIPSRPRARHCKACQREKQPIRLRAKRAAARDARKLLMVG